MNMNYYKVEIVQTEKFVIDVQAESEIQALEAAQRKWNQIADSGMAQYHQVGDTEVTIGTIYDVTGTEDALNESTCMYNHDHAAEPEKCEVHN